MLKNKKAQIWISAVLYIAIGVIAIAIVLSAGVPLINKLKDKNTIIQTKELMLSLDNVIREIRDEGPGSRRVIQPFVIKDGTFFINDKENKIEWNLKTGTLFAEPCGKSVTDCKDNAKDPAKNLIIKEGAINIYQLETIIENEYNVHLEIDYKDIAKLEVKEDSLGKDAPLLGSYTLTFDNKETEPSSGLPKIYVSVS